jgi:hypothetical protein
MIFAVGVCRVRFDGILRDFSFEANRETGTYTITRFTERAVIIYHGTEDDAPAEMLVLQIAIFNYNFDFG